jgi:predicted transcriptional regulator
MKPADLLPIWKTQTEIASALQVTQAAVSQWFQANRVPLLRQYQINQLVGLPIEDKIHAEKEITQ